MRCEDAQDFLSDHLDQALAGDEAARLETHLEGCADCRRELDELRWLTSLLHELPAEPMPENLPERIHLALAALPDEAPADPAPVLPRTPEKGATVLARPWWRRSVASAIGGAAVAALAIGVWGLQPSTLPRIETAAVQPQQEVALNIGFDVDQSVDNVTFQIDLPEGLQFVNEQHQTMAAQTVSWKGSLKQGQTVVPIMVRGMRPGRYEIHAMVKKGHMLRKTTIVVPVQYQST